jgi:ATP-dependent DNA ligase
MRKGIQLAYPLEEKRLLKWQPPYIVQPKYDGDRARAVRLPSGNFCLLSSEENLIFGVPHVLKALDSLPLPQHLELDGELYAHRMPHAIINGIVSRTNELHPEFQKICYCVFDIVDEEKPQSQRLVLLNDMLKHSKHPIQVAPFFLCETLDEIMRVYDRFLEQGYEGIIVRHHAASYVRKRSTYMVKFKPKREDCYPIIGYKEEVSITGVPKGRLGALICKTDDCEFSVGSGLTDEDRVNLWSIRDQLRGMTARVQYQHTLPSGSPRFPVLVTVFKN